MSFIWISVFIIAQLWVSRSPVVEVDGGKDFDDIILTESEQYGADTKLLLRGKREIFIETWKLIDTNVIVVLGMLVMIGLFGWYYRKKAEEQIGGVIRIPITEEPNIEIFIKRSRNDPEDYDDHEDCNDHDDQLEKVTIWRTE